MLIPEYAENIIVGVKYNGSFNWYITDTELWYLDYNQAGYSIEEYPKERKNMSILNENTANSFLINIESFKSSTNSLKQNFFKELNQNKEEATYNYNPSILIDFDNQILYSNYPESISFEEYLPDNWNGYFQRFFENIPQKYRYWEEHNTNFLTRKD
ncbi:hypothetical protein HCB49_01005 [Listeria sp. FSL L7-0123]|uniref:Uncharacterized protein n=1 Tax=Listeria cossartiae subsp. cayugensis TaxID=2713505 RepID=A0A7X0ZA81_9LIST|nr:hypothetical protein [Listeria cossartiae]MBC2248581.1 hypothetical protein [Listeria cossartiae subsp. cayugensis]